MLPLFLFLFATTIASGIYHVKVNVNYHCIYNVNYHCIYNVNYHCIYNVNYQLPITIPLPMLTTTYNTTVSAIDIWINIVNIDICHWYLDYHWYQLYLAIVFGLPLVNIGRPLLLRILYGRESFTYTIYGR